MTAVITGDESRHARGQLGLSQGKVAREIGINRTYLSLFESGRYLLSDAELVVLRDFFEANGFERHDHAQAASVAEVDGARKAEGEGLRWDVTRVIDGFVIPPAVPENDAERILSAYANNTDCLQATLAAPLKRGFLGLGIDWEDADEKRQQALLMMAMNWLLIEEARGHRPIGAMADKTPTTVGEHLASEIDKQMREVWAR